MNLIKKIKTLSRDDLIAHTIIVFMGTTFVGICNLLYHLVSVRLLSVEDYGTFNTLISFVMFSSMAISPLGTTLTRYFTEYITKRDFSKLAAVIIKIIKRLAVAAVVVILFFLICAPYLAGFLKTEINYIYFCAAIVILPMFSPIAVSLFQSFQKFKIYAFVGAASSFGKLITGALLMLAGFKVVGALGGFLSGSALILVIALLFVPRIFRREIGPVNSQKAQAVNLLPLFKYFFPVSVALLSFTFITMVDVILVKHFFSELQTGYYSIAQMVGKIALFLPSSLAIVLLPKSTKAHVSNEPAHKILYKSLFLAGIFCLGFIAFTFLFPDLLLKVLAGSVNPVSRSLVGLFALAMSFYALSWIVINYLLGIHNLKFVAPFLVLTILEAVAIYNWHSSLTMVLYILLAFAIISLAGLLYFAGDTHKRRQ